MSKVLDPSVVPEAGETPAVVITGASSGIGEACALRLDRLGFRVFAGVRRDAAGAALAAKASARLVPVHLDVTDADSLARAETAVRAVVGAGGLAGLVNNAGISVAGPLEYIPLSALRSQLEVNAIGPVATTQAFLPLLRAGQGRVINIGSIAGRIATPLSGAYSASKFALEAITDALRMELLPWGLHVSIIEPGVVATPIWQRGLAMADELMRYVPPEGLARYGRLIAGLRSAVSAGAHRGLPPDAVARVVAHALTVPRPQSRYVLGVDARLRLMLRRLPIPDRVRDRLILRLMERSAKPQDEGQRG